MEIELGTRVQYTGLVVKEHDANRRTDWVALTDPDTGEEIVFEPPAEGIVIGVRHFQPGTTEAVVETSTFGYYVSSHTEYRPEIGVTRKVYLVVTDMRTKPVMVFPRQLQIIGG